MLRRIPKSFELGPHTIQVRIVSEEEMRRLCERYNDTVPEDETAPQGYTVFDENVIYVRRATKRFTKSMQMHAFWHEYFHMLLDRAHRERLARDETLVDSLGGLQLQAFNTIKF